MTLPPAELVRHAKVVRPPVPTNGELANSADAGWSLAEALSAKLDGIQEWIDRTVATYGQPK